MPDTSLLINTKLSRYKYYQLVNNIYGYYPEIKRFLFLFILCMSLLQKNVGADIITYDFEYINSGKTVALGWFTLKNNFSNDQDEFIFTKTSGLLDFEIIINNENHDNLTINYEDIDSLYIFLRTGGEDLDFSKELVGQETLYDPWGTPPYISNPPIGWADFGIGTYNYNTHTYPSEGAYFSNIWFFAQEFAIEKTILSGSTSWDIEYLGMLSSLRPAETIKITEPRLDILLLLGFIGIYIVYLFRLN